jgi:hypothetical protein
MTSYLDRPAEGQPDDRQIGLKCVHARMDTWVSFVNLVRQGSVTNQRTEVRSHPACLATVTDTQTSVTPRLVSVTSQLVFVLFLFQKLFWPLFHFTMADRGRYSCGGDEIPLCIFRSSVR